MGDRNDQQTWAALNQRPIRSHSAREFLAELLGSFVFISLGMMGSVWTATTCGGFKGILLPFIWGMALACAMFVCGGYSGGQLNPTLSLGLFCTNSNNRNFKKLLLKMMAQYMGGILAISLVATLSYQWIFIVFGDNWQTNSEVIGIFAPSDSVNAIGPAVLLFDAVFATFVFNFLVLAICDSQNLGSDRFLFPIFIGGAMTSVSLAFGAYNGVSVSPVHLLVPRIMASLLGVDFVWNWYVLANFVLYHVGGLGGVLLYDLIWSAPEDTLTAHALFPASAGGEQTKLAAFFGYHEIDRTAPTNMDYLIENEYEELKKKHVG